MTLLVLLILLILVIVLILLQLRVLLVRDSCSSIQPQERKACHCTCPAAGRIVRIWNCLCCCGLVLLSHLLKALNCLPYCETDFLCLSPTLLRLGKRRERVLERRLGHLLRAAG